MIDSIRLTGYNPVFMKNMLKPYLTPEQYADLRAPLASARTLPRQAFTAEDFFALEVDAIFSRHWVALCFAGQLAKPGSLLPLELAGMPLLAVRGAEHPIRVFHNIVPYDGCLAVIDAAQAGEEGIVTPYHGWRYDLHGKLQATPYWDGFAAADLSALQGKPGDLLEVECRVEFGVVFVRLKPGTVSFDDWIQPLRSLFAGYRCADLAIGLDENDQPLLDHENLQTNWKTHYENWAVNVLHEGFTHEVYAESAQIPRVNAQGEKTYVEHIDGHLSALCYREQDFAETYELDELPFAHLGTDPGCAPEQSFIGSLFPNLHMAVFPGFVHFIIGQPLSAGQTQTLRAQFYSPESASDPECLEARLLLQEDFHQAGLEDGRITEAVQKARRSPVYTQQYYAPFWDGMHYHFTNTVLAALEATGLDD